MLAARRRPGKLPEGFYAAAEKEADRAMHTAVRKESRPRPRPLSNKTDWSHAKIKIGPRHQKQVARAMDRLFHPSDHVLRDAFRYFLPAELAV